MATVNDIANGALLKLGVRDHDEPADASSAAIALDAYNGLMHEQVEAGWLASFTTQALSATMPLGAAFVEPLKAAVAVRIADSFGRQVSPRVANEASRFQGMLANDYWTTTTNVHRAERGLWEPRPGDFTVET